MDFTKAMVLWGFSPLSFYHNPGSLPISASFELSGFVLQVERQEIGFSNIPQGKKIVTIWPHFFKGEIFSLPLALCIIQPPEPEPVLDLQQPVKSKYSFSANSSSEMRINCTWALTCKCGHSEAEAKAVCAPGTGQRHLEDGWEHQDAPRNK